MPEYIVVTMIEQARHMHGNFSQVIRSGPYPSELSKVSVQPLADGSSSVGLVPR